MAQWDLHLQRRELATSEEQLKLALDAAHMGTFDWDIRKKRVALSRWHEELWGYEPGQFDGSYDGFADRFHPEDLPALRTEVNRCIAAREPFSGELRVLWPNGAIHCIAARGEFTFDASGRPQRMRGAVIDITERKLAEEKARLLMQRLTLATDAASIGVWDWDLKSDEWYASPMYSSMLGYEPDKGSSDRAVWLERVHPDDRDAVRQKISAAVSGSPAPYEYEARLRHADGSYRWIQVLGRVLSVDEQGRASRLLGVRIDMTERKLAELRVQHLNRVYAVLSQINETIVREKDSRAMLAEACRIAVQKGRFLMAWVGGIDPAGGPLHIVAHAGAADDTLEILRSLLGKKQSDCSCAATMAAVLTGEHGVCNDIAHDPQAAPWRSVAQDRGYRAMASLPLKAAERVVGTFNLYAGEVGFFDADEMRLLDELAIDISFALDVHEAETQRRRMEQALRESEDRFRQLAENIQEVFWMVDPASGRTLYVSPAYEKIWGSPIGDAVDSRHPWLDAVHPDDRARIAQAMQTKQIRGDYDETYRIVRPDGTVRWIRDRAYLVRTSTGEVLRIVGTAEDITEARQLEEQLRHSQKMDAIGQLAGGVAHDFNNILAAIMMQAELAVTVSGQPAEGRELLNEIIAATQRAANLTRQLLAFGRRQVMQPRILNLNDIVRSMTKMLQRILGEDVEVELVLHERTLLTSADAGMLDQVLLNLIVNARDAMRGGGRLLIETAEHVLNAADGASMPDASPGRYVSLRVTNTGAGIAPQSLSRIFEPFYTTKEPGKGTGLGLATVFGIVKQHGGWITVASEVGRGSTFCVFLRAAEAARIPVADPVTSSAKGGTETILLVEDEAVVRKSTRVVLERAGYHVLEACNGVEALSVWADHAADIRLVMTDIVMPGGVSGRALAAELYARNPELRIILTSGYSAEIAGRELSREEGQSFIQKPSSAQHVLETVRRCLDR